MAIAEVATTIASAASLSGAIGGAVFLVRTRHRAVVPTPLSGLPNFFEHLTLEDRTWFREHGATWLPEEVLEEISAPDEGELHIVALPWDDGHEHVQEITAAAIRQMSPEDYERYRPWLLKNASIRAEQVTHKSITGANLSESQAMVWESRG